ncbi:MFS transporter [Actinoplanes sp. NPDC049548]|uniref:MFS transporter n=1 Tax=Actinoplanes sp. NPDC049548 TaxID=3155152 RepID=UPI00343D1A0B
MSHATVDTAEAPVALPRRRIRLTMLVLSLAVLFASMDLMVVNVAMYSIIKEFDPTHGVDDSRWILTVYTLALGASQPVYGKLADLFGGKRVMLFSMLLFLSGSVACGLSANMTQLIVFRGLQGLGAGGLLSVAVVVAAQIAEPRNRAKYAGYTGGLALIGFVAGPLVGGFFADTHHYWGLTVDWRWAFFLNVPTGLLVIGVLGLLLPNFVARPGLKVDYLGALLMVGGISALLLVVEWGGDRYAWGSTPILALAATGVLLLTGFVLQERRASEPIIPPRLYRDQAFRIAVPLSVLAGFAMMGMSYYIALYLRLVRQLGSLATCLHMLPMLLGMLVGLLATGIIIADGAGYKKFPIIGAALAAIGCGLCVLLDSDTPTWELSVFLLVFGFGIGQLTQVPLATVQNSVPEKDLGTASTAVVFVRMLGQSLGPAIFGAVLSIVYATRLPSGLDVPKGERGQMPSSSAIAALPADVQHALNDAFLGGLHGVFVAGAAALVLAFAIAFLYKEQPAKPAAAEAVVPEGRTEVGSVR